MLAALNGGDALRGITAESELLHHLGDALDPKTAVEDGLLGFVLIGKALKMFLEQELKGIDPAWAVHPLRDDRGALKR